MREAGIQEFLSEAGIVPLTIVYEDLVAEYEVNVRRVLDFLEISGRETAAIPPSYYDKQTDEMSEKWVQRFRRELQADWHTGVGVGRNDFLT